MAQHEMRGRNYDKNYSPERAKHSALSGLNIVFDFNTQGFVLQTSNCVKGTSLLRD